MGGVGSSNWTVGSNSVFVKAALYRFWGIKTNRECEAIRIRCFLQSTFPTLDWAEREAQETLGYLTDRLCRNYSFPLLSSAGQVALKPSLFSRIKMGTGSAGGLFRPQQFSLQSPHSSFGILTRSKAPLSLFCRFIRLCPLFNDSHGRGSLISSPGSPEALALGGCGLARPGRGIRVGREPTSFASLLFLIGKILNQVAFNSPGQLT